MFETTANCIKCGACEGRCPMGLDIPRFLELYNQTITKGKTIDPKALESIPEDKRPDKCIGCGSCQLACPENIEIWKTMGRLANMMKEA